MRGRCGAPQPPLEGPCTIYCHRYYPLRSSHAPLVLYFHPPVIVPFGLAQRRSVNFGSCNCGGGLLNTCIGTSASSVPVLSYNTCPGLRCLTLSLHSYTPTRLLLRVTYPISHCLPQLGNDFFVHELLENVDAISPRGNARFLHVRPSVPGTIQARGRRFGHGNPLHRARHR